MRKLISKMFESFSTQARSERAAMFRQMFGLDHKRLREGAKIIILDPRRIDLVRTPHIEADYHLQLRPGTNVT